MKKLFTPVILCMITGFLFAIAVQSCKSNKSLAEPVFKPFVVMVPQPVKHDTIRTKPRPLTESEQQAMIDKFYDYGYKKYYGPQFKALNDVIINQAQSLDRISTILTVTRKRTDSIVKERNFYKENFIKKQEETIKLQQEILKTQRENLKAQQDYYTKNDKQIRSNTIMSVICLVAVGILAITFFGLWYRVNSLYRIVAPKL